MSLQAPLHAASTVQDTGCCPRFDPSTISNEEFFWQDKLFVLQRLKAVFHMPFGMERKVRETSTLIQAAGAQLERPLMLMDDRTPFRSDLLMEVSKEVPGAEMVRLSGRFLAKVFEGPYRQAPTWMRSMQEFAAARGCHIVRLYSGYTTCPRCAKAYGENYVVLFAQVIRP